MEGGDSGDENYEPPKKIKTEWSKSYSNKALDMMLKMGFDNEKGLGKMSQGRLEPVVAVQQGGRRGLGAEALYTDETWDFASEPLHIPEKVEWLNNPSDEHEEMVFPFTLNQLKSWTAVDNKKDTIDDETLFCDQNILEQVLACKKELDKIDDENQRRARSRSNPFETIRSSIFLNRAAVKMANIDAMCDFMFTNVRDKLGFSQTKDDLLYFADICAGPGGFSEYILYRKKWQAKGFGFTLRGPNDFKLDKFFAGSPESFDPYYGIKDDGDIYDTDNQDSLANYIHQHVSAGVHFVMADGGFCVEGQENIQEILSKQLYLCQFLTALKILREKGHFVCKLFDLFTPFSVGLIYIMYHCFEQITIIKPNSSRPANSERYLVCKWKLSDTQVAVDYLNMINELINQYKQSNEGLDVLELIDPQVLMRDDTFIDYIKKSNNTIGREQIIGLKKIATFYRNPKLKDMRQTDIRKRCLEFWNLPDKLRQPPEVKNADNLLEEILANWSDNPKFLCQSPVDLNGDMSALANLVKSVYDWYFVPVSRVQTNINACSVFLCRTQGCLLRLTNKKWEPVEYSFAITPKSLFYGQIVFEYSGQGRTQTKMVSLHIIDAIMLGGVDIRKQTLLERLKSCDKYCRSINKPFKEGNLSVRCSRIFRLQDLDKFFNEMNLYTLKDGAQRYGLELQGENKFYVPGGIILLCEIFHTFHSVMSRTKHKLYYFDSTNGHAFYENENPEMASTLYASFRNTFSRRLYWQWESVTQVELDETTRRQPGLLHRIDLQNFINAKLAA